MVSPRLSAGGVRFWGRPAPAGGLGGPCGPLTGPASRARPQRGYHVPHRVAAKGEGAWSTPGPGCPTGRRLGPPRPVSPLLPSGLTIASGNCTNNGASSQVHSRSPVPSFPRPVRPDGSDAPWALAFGFAPRRYRRRTRRREPTLDTGRGLTTTTPERLRVALSHSASVIGTALLPGNCTRWQSGRFRACGSSDCPSEGPPQLVGAHAGGPGAWRIGGFALRADATDWCVKDLRRRPQSAKWHAQRGGLAPRAWRTRPAGRGCAKPGSGVRGWSL